MAVNESLPTRRSQFHEPEDDVAAALAGVAAGSHGSSDDESKAASRPRRAGDLSAVTPSTIPAGIRVEASGSGSQAAPRIR